MTVAKDRNDFAGQTIQVEWHLCLVQILHKLQEFMSETRQAPESFPGRIIFASVFNDIFDNTSKKVWSGGVRTARKKLPPNAATFRPGFWCFCGPGSEQTWTNNESRPMSHFANGEWGKLASVMISELLTSKHHVF